MSALVGASGALSASASQFGILGGVAVAGISAVVLGRWVRLAPDGYAWAWAEGRRDGQSVLVLVVSSERERLGAGRFPV